MGKFCKYCGSELNDGSKFCPKCGAKIEEIIEKVKRYKTYMNLSGGGVTVTGGEPLLQVKFLIEYFKRLKEEKINTAKKHLKLAVEEHGEYVAVREMRKHIAWYLKGLRNSARVRDEINKIESYEEVVNKLESYMQDCLTLE